MRELIDAIRAAPDDDAPRQVLADYLIERGDPRGESLALALAGAEVVAQPTHVHDVVVAYRHGLIEGIVASAAALAALPAEALALTCVRRLGVFQVGDADACAAILRLLPELALRALELDIGPSSFPALIAAPALDRLASLELRPLRAGWLDALIAARLPELVSLRLPSCRLSPADLRRVVARFPLRELSICGNDLGMSVVDTLLDQPGLRAVEHLDLAYTAVGEEDVFALCASDIPLRHLELSGNVLGPAAARRIAGTPRFAQLTYLGLGDAMVGDDGVAALIASPYLPRSLRLGLDGERLGLEPDIWYDQGAAIGSSWKGEPRRDLTARFRVELVGVPAY